MHSWFVLCWEEKRSWVEGYPWAYHVRPYKLISYSVEWLFTAGTRCTTYPTLPPFLFDLLHLSSAVPGSLLELPPHRPGPLDRERETEKMEKMLRVGEASPRDKPESQARGEQAQIPTRAGGIAEQGTPSTDKTPVLNHKDKRQRERLSSF